MTPQLSADMREAGLLATQEALWVCGDKGMIVQNMVTMFKNEEVLS